MANTAKHLQKYNEQNRKVDKDKAIQLYNSGLSCNQIAEIFKCSKFPVLKALKNTPKRRMSEYPQHHSKHQFGENNPAWKGGIKSVYDRIRDLNQYWNWRKAVLYRDNNKCIDCGVQENLHAHHLKFLRILIKDYCQINKKEIKELTQQDLTQMFFYNIDNGVTLCEECHKKWHKIHGR